MTEKGMSGKMREKIEEYIKINEKFKDIWNKSDEEKFQAYQEALDDLGVDDVFEESLKELSEKTGITMENLRTEAMFNPEKFMEKMESLKEYNRAKSMKSVAANSKRNEILAKYPDYDRIVLDSKGVDVINEFAEKYLESGQSIEMRAPMNKGVMIIEYEGREVGETPIFAFELLSEREIKLTNYLEFSSEIYSTCLVADGNVLHLQPSQAAYKYGTDKKAMVDTFRKNAQGNFLTLVCFLAFLERYEKEVVVEKHSVAKTKKGKSKGKSKKKSKNTVRITRKSYRIDNIAVQQRLDEEKRPHNWHVDAFNRIGHWRTYKDGRRVWIKPTTVYTSNKEKAEITPKEYRV